MLVAHHSVQKCIGNGFFPSRDVLFRWFIAPVLQTLSFLTHIFLFIMLNTGFEGSKTSVAPG